MFDTCFQVINERDSSFAAELQEELEENLSPVVDENNIVSATKQGPNLHNWSGDWTTIVVTDYIFFLISSF